MSNKHGVSTVESLYSGYAFPQWTTFEEELLSVKEGFNFRALSWDESVFLGAYYLSTGAAVLLKRQNT